MKAFTQLTGLVAPLDRNNVDASAIIPKQFSNPSNTAASAKLF